MDELENTQEVAQERVDTAYINARIYTSSGVIKEGTLFIGEDGTIRDVGPANMGLPYEIRRIDMGGATILPGLIDIHVHGSGGYEMMDATVEGLSGMSRFLAARGTTAFLGTTTTDDPSRITEMLVNGAAVIDQGNLPGAEMAGIHLEGPFLNEERCGGQNPQYLRTPTIHELQEFMNAAKGLIHVVTIAPELEGGMEAVRWLSEQGVTVSIGHSDATYEQVLEAVRNGARQTTHHFNGMSPLHHRAPGVAGAGLLIPELVTEVIADGVHVHPGLIRCLYELKGPEGVCLITDAVVCSGLPDGRYGRRMVIDGQIYLYDGSCLSGSALTALQAVKNALKFTGYTLEQILPSMTIVPARQIGLADRKGSLSPGKDADFLMVDDGLNLQATYVRGTEVFRA